MMGNIRFIPDLSQVKLSPVSILSEQQNWGLSFIDVEDAWKVTKGANINVAVIDTGWNEHKDLLPNFVEGFDATGNNDFIDHGCFHGTHVAGIIAANCGENIGVKGVAPEAKLYPIKALNDDGTGSFDYIVKALEIVEGLNVDIVNMSLGSSVKPFDDRIQNLFRRIVAQGKIVVCASGNDGGDVNYPAKYDEAIAVAAVESDGKLARFSSRGPELDAAAPGVKIYSTWGNNTYINLDGTSMACPCMTGMVALILAYHKQHTPNFRPTYLDMLKTLYHLGEQNIINLGSYNVGVPKLFNYNWGT